MPGHPLQQWPVRGRRRALLLLVMAAVLPLVLAAVVQPLREGDPGGESIVAFELAGSVDRAEEILSTWRAAGVLDEAKAIQIFDVVYPLVYTAALAGCCLAAAGAWTRSGRARLQAAGIVAAWVALAAAGFDYVENVGLAVSLWDEPASPWPQLALVAGLLKFAATAVALMYSLSGVVAWRIASRP